MQDRPCRDLVVRNGKLHTPNGFIKDGAVVIVDGKIAYIGSAEHIPGSVTSPATGKAVAVSQMPALDASGCIVAPGLLDVHTHGGGGCDVMDATVAAMQVMARAHGKHGTTGLLAATVTAGQDTLEKIAHTVGEAMQLSHQAGWNGAQILGLHLEGPYLSPAKKGAQDPDYMRAPSQAELERIFSIIGSGFKHITLAPELPGAIEMVRWLRQRGVRVSMGHTDAGYDIAIQAIAAGADHATHTFNAMPALHHREPGLLGAVLGSDAVTAELIADGIHVHPGAMRLAYKAKGACHICLITDAMAAMDMPDGRYQLGGLPVEVRNGAARLVENGSLAGSVLTLDRAIKNVVEMCDIPLAEAIDMATSVPARQLSMTDTKGTLEEGKDGDLCVLGGDLLCQATVVAGQLLSR